MAPIGVCEGVGVGVGVGIGVGIGVGVGVGDVGTGRLGVLVVGLVVVEIGPELDLAWSLEEQVAL
jgi:lactose/raffinose/galactose permease